MKWTNDTRKIVTWYWKFDMTYLFNSDLVHPFNCNTLFVSILLAVQTWFIIIINILSIMSKLSACMYLQMSKASFNFVRFVANVSILNSISKTVKYTRPINMKVHTSSPSIGIIRVHVAVLLVTSVMAATM